MKEQVQDTASMDPTEEITLRVHSLNNAGAKVKSRFGAVEFDKDGNADMTVRLCDVPLVDSLGWLSAADREHFGLAAAAAVAQVNTDGLISELAAQKEVSARLAAKNAELEASCDMMKTQLADLKKVNEAQDAHIKKASAHIEAQNAEMTKMDAHIKKLEEAAPKSKKKD